MNIANTSSPAVRAAVRRLSVPQRQVLGAILRCDPPVSPADVLQAWRASVPAGSGEHEPRDVRAALKALLASGWLRTARPLVTLTPLGDAAREHARVLLGLPDPDRAGPDGGVGPTAHRVELADGGTAKRRGAALVDQVSLLVRTHHPVSVQMLAGLASTTRRAVEEAAALLVDEGRIEWCAPGDGERKDRLRPVRTAEEARPTDPAASPNDPSPPPNDPTASPNDPSPPSNARPEGVSRRAWAVTMVERFPGLTCAELAEKVGEGTGRDWSPSLSVAVSKGKLEVSKRPDGQGARYYPVGYVGDRAPVDAVPKVVDERPSPITGPSARPPSVSRREWILGLLREHPDGLRAEDIARLTGEGPAQVWAPDLSALRKAGVLHAVGGGRWDPARYHLPQHVDDEDDASVAPHEPAPEHGNEPSPRARPNASAPHADEAPPTSEEPTYRRPDGVSRVAWVRTLLRRFPGSSVGELADLIDEPPSVVNVALVELGRGGEVHIDRSGGTRRYTLARGLTRLQVRGATTGDVQDVHPPAATRGTPPAPRIDDVRVLADAVVEALVARVRPELLRVVEGALVAALAAHAGGDRG